MKRIFLIILLFMFLVGIGHAALTYDETYYMQHLAYLHSGSSTTDPMYLFINESIGYLDGTSDFGSVYLIWHLKSFYKTKNDCSISFTTVTTFNCVI